METIIETLDAYLRFDVIILLVIAVIAIVIQMIYLMIYKNQNKCLKREVSDKNKFISQLNHKLKECENRIELMKKQQEELKSKLNDSSTSHNIAAANLGINAFRAFTGMFSFGY